MNSNLPWCCENRSNLFSHVTLTNEHDEPRLFEVWQSSVRATHSFLSDADLATLIPLARAEIAAFTPIYCLRDAHARPIAMLGMQGRKIDMLFVHADHRGRGAGRVLTEFAIRELDANCVDVNEQNDLAVGFYEYMGFHRIGRSEVDSAGHPFPLLHLALRSA
jgi:putative acetyltransferase